MEDYESAKERGASIYAEVLGGQVNSGGQRDGGTMTAPNSAAVVKCISEAIENSHISPSDVDTINAHLTATKMDSTEIKNWSTALNRSGRDFPYINSLKGLIGHGLAACGSLELVASILQLKHGFVFGNKNATPVHPDILKLIDGSKIPLKTIEYQPEILAKASFGFGDVNACVILKQCS